MTEGRFFTIDALSRLDQNSLIAVQSFFEQLLLAIETRLRRFEPIDVSGPVDKFKKLEEAGKSVFDLVKDGISVEDAVFYVYSDTDISPDTIMAHYKRLEKREVASRASHWYDLASQGLTNQEIAAKEGVCAQTVGRALKKELSSRRGGRGHA